MKIVTDHIGGAIARILVRDLAPVIIVPMSTLCCRDRRKKKGAEKEKRDKGEIKERGREEAIRGYPSPEALTEAAPKFRVQQGYG